MAYRFDWESSRAVYVQFYGDINDADLSAASDRLFNDDRVDYVREVIWDFTGIRSFRVSLEQVELIAASDYVASTYLAPIKSAFVIQAPDLAEFAKNYIAVMDQFGTHWQNRLFGSVGAARDWMAA